MTRPARVLISAGEASGDLYGGLLMQAMSVTGAASPGAGTAVEFAGIGGPRVALSTGLCEVCHHIRMLRGKE